MGKTTVIGIIIGVGAIFLGHVLEDGQMSSLLQGTAFLIVFGGTLGAVIVSNPVEDIQTGLRLFFNLFNGDEDLSETAISSEIIDCAKIAKKESLMALEAKMPMIRNPFLKKVIRSRLDGIDLAVVREIYETEIMHEEEDLLAGVKIWSDAGGFAPTIGILGAVLGLIHVMGSLTDTNTLGAGIAVAFVATVYGVGFANLFFLPISNNLKKYVARKIRKKYLALEGALLINTESNSITIEQKLSAFHVQNEKN